ncbi:MAG: hypothetical protein J5912_06215 [Clostridia bacterium]|nr:hypothetical protein [Clostridia bacterium]
MSLFDKIKSVFKKKKTDPPQTPEAPQPDPDDFGDRGSPGAGEGAVPTDAKLKSFRFSYDGTIGGDSYWYRFNAEEEPAVFAYESMLYPDYGEMKTEPGPELLEGLTAIYRELKLCEWNGFDMVNIYVCDGSGFSTSMYFEDGSSMRANGSNSFPPRYREFKQRIDELFKPYVEKMIEEKRLEAVKKGVNGQIDSFLCSFYSRSGGPRYGFLMHTKPGARTNFEVTVEYSDGKYFPEGKFVYHRTVSDEQLRFERLDEIVRKYDMCEWMGFDRHSEEKDAEWFQLSISYEEGHIDAMGTAHPEHYEEVREEILSYMSELVKEIQAAESEQATEA